jgi:hypothetical protein
MRRFRRAPESRLSRPPAHCVAIAALSLFATTLGAQTQTLATLTTSFIAPIRSAMTLGAWRRAHPGDTILRSWEGNGFVQCAAAHRSQPIAGGETADVRLMFYVPPMPRSRQLPVHDTPDQALDRCQAGMVRITLYDTNAAPITRIHQALERDFAAVHLLGDAVQPWLQSAVGSVDGLSRHDDSVIVASARFMGGKQGEIGFGCCQLTVHVAARRTHEDPDLPGWQSLPPAPGSASPDLNTKPVASPLATMFRIAGIGGALERGIQAMFTQVANSDVPSDTVITLLRRWLTALKPLPSVRRSAALVIADSLMMSWNSFILADSAGNTLHDRLAGIGVTFSFQRGDEEEAWYYIYQRDWAMQAYRIAPTSRAGEYAFLHIIATDGRCATNQSSSIARSESYLHQYPNAHIRGPLHAFLGAEWAAEFTGYSADANGEFSPANSKRPQTELARQRAIAHFQAAFRLNIDPEHTWNSAFLVLAGLPFTENDGDCE